MIIVIVKGMKKKIDPKRFHPKNVLNGCCAHSFVFLSVWYCELAGKSVNEVKHAYNSLNIQILKVRVELSGC